MGKFTLDMSVMWLNTPIDSYKKSCKSSKANAAAQVAAFHTMVHHGGQGWLEERWLRTWLSNSKSGRSGWASVILSQENELGSYTWKLKG